MTPTRPDIRAVLASAEHVVDAIDLTAARLRWWGEKLRYHAAVLDDRATDLERNGFRGGAQEDARESAVEFRRFAAVLDHAATIRDHLDHRHHGTAA